jgi:type 1 glutamine amidotransferase
MHNSTTEQTRNRLRSFVESGGGILSLHHAIVDYTDWPWWYEKVTGGKYFVEPIEDHSASHFKEDEEFLVTIAQGKHNHPVVKGIGPLWVYDELYRGMYLSPDIEVLMETSHPANDRPVVYVGPHQKARVVYIQLGHSDDTMKDPGFRKLVSNAVKWISRKTD